MPVKTNIKVSTLSYAIVYVKDTAKALNFYRDILGATVKVDSPGWVEFETGATTLALHVDEDQSPRGRSSVVPVFPVENIRDAFHALKEAGVKIRKEPHEVCQVPGGVGMSLDFEDPDGNLLSFYGVEKK